MSEYLYTLLFNVCADVIIYGIPSWMIYKCVNRICESIEDQEAMRQGYFDDDDDEDEEDKEKEGPPPF